MPIYLIASKKAPVKIFILLMHCLFREDGFDMAMKENAAYGPVTASQQPQDCIYAQPDNNTESAYDIVK